MGAVKGTETAAGKPGSAPSQAELNSTGATLAKIWDDICLPDDPKVRELSGRMDVIVKAYVRGDTRLVQQWVGTAKLLSAASVKAGGSPLPKEFIAAPVVVAKGTTEKGTPVPPPAVVVTTVDEATKREAKQEVAVLTDGTQVQPHPAMPTPEDVAAAQAAGQTSTQGGGWGVPLLLAGAVVLWAAS